MLLLEEVYPLLDRIVINPLTVVNFIISVRNSR